MTRTSQNHSTRITENPADGFGTIDGFEIACTCGMTWTTSLPTLAQIESAQHFAWHVKQDRALQHAEVACSHDIPGTCDYCESAS